MFQFWAVVPQCKRGRRCRQCVQTKGTDMDEARRWGAWRTDEELGGWMKIIDDGQRRKTRIHPWTSSERPLASLTADRRCHCHCQHLTERTMRLVLADGGQCTGTGRAISIIVDGWMIRYSSVGLKMQEESSSVECMEELMSFFPSWDTLEWIC